MLGSARNYQVGNALRVTSDSISVGKGAPPSDLIVTDLLNDDSNDMGVDGSSTPVEFSYSVPANRVLIAGRLISYLAMTGGGFSDIQFGNLTALTNGVSIRADGVEIMNWKDNIDIVTTMYDSQGYAVFAKITNSIAGRWTFTKAAPGTYGGVKCHDSFSMVIRDNLSAAGIIYRAKIHGILVDED